MEVNGVLSVFPPVFHHRVGAVALISSVTGDAAVHVSVHGGVWGDEDKHNKIKRKQSVRLALKDPHKKLHFTGKTATFIYIIDVIERPHVPRGAPPPPLLCFYVWEVSSKFQRLIG